VYAYLIDDVKFYFLCPGTFVYEIYFYFFVAVEIISLYKGIQITSPWLCNIYLFAVCFCLCYVCCCLVTWYNLSQYNVDDVLVEMTCPRFVFNWFFNWFLSNYTTLL